MTIIIFEPNASEPEGSSTIRQREGLKLLSGREIHATDGCASIIHIPWDPSCNSRLPLKIWPEPQRKEFLQETPTKGAPLRMHALLKFAPRGEGQMPGSDIIILLLIILTIINNNHHTINNGINHNDNNNDNNTTNNIINNADTTTTTTNNNNDDNGVRASPPDRVRHKGQARLRREGLEELLLLRLSSSYVLSYVVYVCVCGCCVCLLLCLFLVLLLCMCLFVALFAEGALKNRETMMKG